MIQTEIAVLRFGLGARPGDLAAAAGDPRAWLMAQIKGAMPLAGNTPLAPSGQIFAELLAARSELQEVKRGEAARSRTVPKTTARSAFNPVRDAYLPHYRAQVLARAQSAALTSRPFAERLVHFWTNHFAVSADKVLVVTEFGRTAAMNGTRGTDHGTGGCAFLAGGAVRGGRVIADWPGFARTALLDNRDLRPTLDLRSVFKAVLDEHLRVDAKTLATRIFPDSSGARPLQGLMRA